MPTEGATSQRSGTVIVSWSTETTRSNVSRSSSRGGTIQSRQTQASARHVGRRGPHVPCRSGSTCEGRAPSTRTTRVRAHPVDKKICRTETKASRGQGSNKESARGSTFGRGLAKGGGKFARRGRTEARRIDDRGEGYSVSIPSHSSLQRQRRVGPTQGRDRQIAAAAGWDPSCCCARRGSQSHPRKTPRFGILDESPSRGFACRDRGKQCSEKVAIDHVVSRRATTTPFFGGRRCFFLEEEFCTTAPGEGRSRPVLRAVRVVGSRYGLRSIRVCEACHPGPTTGPTRRDTSSDEEPVNLVGEVRNVRLRVPDVSHPPPSAHVDVVDMTMVDTDTSDSGQPLRNREK